MRLQDRVAIVTGAGGGIGAGIALAFARNGATVVATDLELERVERVASEISDDGGKAIAVAHDVTDPDAAAQVVSDTIARYGQLDILVNVAGVGSFGHFNDVTLAEFERVLRIKIGRAHV